MEYTPAFPAEDPAKSGTAFVQAEQRPPLDPALELLLSTTQLGVFIQDYASLHTLACNQRVLQMFGARDQVQFGEAFSVNLVASPVSTETEETWRNNWMMRIDFETRLQYHRLDGRLFWGHWHMRFVELNGHVYTVNTIQDISSEITFERRQVAMQRRIKAQARLVPDSLVMLVGPQNEVIAAEGSLYPPENWVGKPLDQVLGWVLEPAQLPDLLRVTRLGEAAQQTWAVDGLRYRLHLEPADLDINEHGYVQVVLQNLGEAKAGLGPLTGEMPCEAKAESSPMGMCRFDFQTQQLTWTPIMENLLGYEPGQVAPSVEAFVARVHPDDQHLFGSYRGQLAPVADARIEIAYRLVLPNGAVRDMRCYLYTEVNDGGQCFCTGLHYDQTHLLAIQERLHLDQQFLKVIFSQAPDAMLLIDAETFSVAEVNQEALRLFDAMHPSQLKGLSPTQLHVDLPRDTDVSTLKARLLTSIEPVSFTTECIACSGKTFWADAALRHMVINGKPYILARFLDVTDRHRAVGLLNYNETLLKNIFNESPDGLLLLHEEAHSVVRANARLLELFEANDLNVLLAARFNNILEHELPDAVRFSMWQAISQHQQYHNRLQYTTLSGRRIWVEVIMKRLRIDDVNYLLARLRDVTMIVTAERDLQSSEQRYRSLFEINPQPMWLLDESSEVVLKANAAALKLYGFHLNEAFGSPFQDMVGAALPHGHADDTGTCFHGVLQHFTRSGRRIEVQLMSGTLPSDGNETRSRLVVATDLTAQREAERELRTQREYLTRILDALPNPVLVKTLEGRLVIANRALSQNLGLPLDYVLNNREADYLPKEKWQLYSHVDREVAATRQPVTYEEQLVDPATGEVRYQSATKVPLVMPDGSVQVIGVITDLTERKRFENEIRLSQQMFESIFDNSADALLLIDAHTHQIKAVNEQTLKLFAYSPAQMLETSLASFMDRHLVAGHQLITAPEAYSSELQFADLSGKNSFWGSLAMRGFEVGQVSYQLVRISDITDRKTLEVQLRNSVREKEVLIKEIHHRVKNNLAIISGLLHLQAHYFEEKHVQEAFRDSQSRIQGMALIHEQLYQADLLAEIAFDNYVKSLVNQLRSVLAGGPLELTVDTQPLVLDITRAVPAGLLLNELVTNSFKHAMGHQPVARVTVSLTLDGEYAQIQVRDNGPGLDPEIFDKPVKNSLGLTLIKELTRQLRGTIDVEVKDGTCVRVRFRL